MRLAIALLIGFLFVILLPWIFQPLLSALIVLMIYLTYTGFRLFIFVVAAIPALILVKKVWRSKRV